MATELGQWGFTILLCLPTVPLLWNFWWPQGMWTRAQAGLAEVDKRFHCVAGWEGAWIADFYLYPSGGTDPGWWNVTLLTESFAFLSWFLWRSSWQITNVHIRSPQWKPIDMVWVWFFCCFFFNFIFFSPYFLTAIVTKHHLLHWVFFTTSKNRYRIWVYRIWVYRIWSGFKNIW